MNALTVQVLSVVPMIDIPGPTPIPGTETALSTILGYMIWCGLIVCALSIVAAIVAVCGMVFLGWHGVKKHLGAVFGSIAGAFALGSLSTIIGVLVPGV